MDLFRAFEIGIEPSIPKEEQKYYQDPSYYRDYAPSMALDAVNGMKRVVPFFEQIQSETKTSNGLYRAEVALLKYCSYGTYPHPRYGYPGLWWYRYGIKNVGFRLLSLERRGFIKLNEKGKYFLTEMGEKELEENSFLLERQFYPQPNHTTVSCFSQEKITAQKSTKNCALAIKR